MRSMQQGDLLMEPKKPALIHRVRRWPRTLLITVGVVAVVLIAARIALPHLVKNNVNQRLREIPGYAGLVELFEKVQKRRVARLIE